MSDMEPEIIKHAKEELSKAEANLDTLPLGRRIALLRKLIKAYEEPEELTEEKARVDE